MPIIPQDDDPIQGMPVNDYDSNSWENDPSIKAPPVGERASWNPQPLPPSLRQYPAYSDNQGSYHPAMSSENIGDERDLDVARGPDVKPISQTLTDRVRDKGAYSDIPSYMADVRTEAYRLAPALGVDLRSDEGKQWMDQTINDAKSRAQEFIQPTIDPKAVKELSDGTVINLITGKIIHQPFSATSSQMNDVHSDMSDMQNRNGDAAANGIQPIPLPTAMQKAIDMAHSNPAFAATKQGQSALKEEDRVNKDKAAASGGLTDDAIDNLARQYMATGKMPTMGMGKEAAQARQAILNKYSELMKKTANTPEEQLAQQEGFKAASHSLSNLQKQKDSILSFANTADKNLDIADKLSDKVIRTNSPFFNKYLLSGRKDFLGDPDVSALHAGVQTAVNEYAKVVAGNGGSSDSARAHAEQMLNEAQTPQAFKAVIKVLKQEVENRRGGYDDQIATLKDTLSGKKVSGVDHKDVAVPKGFKLQTNKKTKETRLVPE